MYLESKVPSQNYLINSIVQIYNICIYYSLLEIRVFKIVCFLLEKIGLPVTESD